MRTKLHQLPDWQQTLQDMGWADAPTEQTIQQAIRQELTRGYVTFVQQDPSEPIAAGCRVTLKTSSALPRFNREKTKVTVGSHLYHAGIEDMLIGMTAGQSGRTQVEGQAVSFCILGVEKKNLPPLCDEMVEAQHLDGIHSLDQYTAYMREKLQRAYAEQLCGRLVDRLAAGAVMDTPDAADIRQVIDREFEPLRVRFSSGGTDLDTIPPDQWKENFYNPKLKTYYEQIYPDVAQLFDTTSKASYYANRQPYAEQTIRRCLVLREILGDTKTAHDPTQALQAERELTQAMVDRLCAILYKKG